MLGVAYYLAQTDHTPCADCRGLSCAGCMYHLSSLPFGLSARGSLSGFLNTNHHKIKPETPRARKAAAEIMLLTEMPA
eukprot:3426880-Rhodomonas_salina.2